MIERCLGLLSAALFCFAVAAIANAAWAGSETRLSLSYDSPAMGRTMAYSVYLPDGYGESDALYPVVFLLHGLGGGEKDWLRAGGAAATADRLIKAGETAPMVLIFPDGEDGWYVDSRSFGGPGDYETALTRDLLAHVESAYRVRRDRTGRAVAGLSMGGYGAIRFALKHPNLYGAAASLSGAIIEDATEEKPVTARQIKLFRGAFGDPFRPEEFNQRNVFGLMETVRRRGPAPRILLTVGDDDYFDLYEGAFATFLALKARDLPHELRIVDGNHKWDLWRRELARALIFLDAGFQN
ncbi:MAG: alpha/beta hydrolase family protein [Alphaproteobacteria bacterium]|nr:alpha/beta hydrolase family protein [Alphaproteobacteria bacterium]